MTELTVIVDTVPPRGTVNISQGRALTNDLDVTLYLDASDRWGVSYVEVSNAEDMFNKLTFAYAPTIRWHLEGVDGVVPVYVRFEDSHGLLSDIVSDSIIYDTFPPIGSLKIDDGATYTPSLLVGLSLEYSDPRGVALVELSDFAVAAAAEISWIRIMSEDPNSVEIAGAGAHPVAAPEPSTVAFLVAGGLAAILGRRLRRAAPRVFTGG